MIKSNELREGNKVISRTHNLLNATVQNIMPHSGIVTLREVSTYDTFNKIDPILLTPEWLQRCGLKDPTCNGMGYRMNVNPADELCWYMQDGFLRYQTQGSGFTRQLKHIKHVHQLQNFYYWLTGKELTINL